MTFKRFILVFLIIFSLFSLVSCKPEDAEADTTVAEAETEAPEAAKLVFVDNGKTDFKVVRSETATGYYLDTAAAVNKKLKEQVCKNFVITDDWLNPREPAPEGVLELLLFDTNRAET